jgi:hypothetical protein
MSSLKNKLMQNHLNEALKALNRANNLRALNAAKNHVNEGRAFLTNAGKIEVNKAYNAKLAKFAKK